VLDDLVFGWRTAVLSVAFVLVLAIAAALTRPLVNRTANRTLAALLVVLAGIITPWMIGFAGFYDKWRWLSFAPFQLTLAVAPLMWLYVRALIDGAWPARGWRHLLPAMVQFAYGAICFIALPVALKDRWLDTSVATVGRAADAGTIAGLAAYGITGLRTLRDYRTALATARSDGHRYTGRWLATAIGATLILLPVWTGYAIWDAVDPLGYTGLMGLYLAVAGFALFLGIEGWRHANLPFPRRAELVPVLPAETRDWVALGQQWAARTRAESWHRDPELSLPTLARRLGTNTAYLSRSINAGLGVSFSSFVNGLRSEDVAAELEAGSTTPLLDLALEAGFSSKASFNRAFVERYGTSPSAWRRANVSKAEKELPLSM
jgi:AraC-like DNA-binding protein